MKNLAIALALLVGAFGSVARPQEKAEPLTVEQALNVATGLGQLTSIDGVDKEGKPTKTYYKFSPDLRLLIAVDIDIGRSVQTQFQNANNALVMQLSDGNPPVPPEKMSAYNVELVKMMAAPARATFHRIKAADLKLDENPIPASVLSLIIPILDR